MSILKFVHFIIPQCKTTTWNDLNFASSELNPFHQYHDSNEIWRLKGSDCFKSLVFSLFPMPTCTRTSPPPFANSRWKHHFWWRIRFSLRLFSVEKFRFLSLTINSTQVIRPQLFYKFLRWLDADRGDFVMVSRGCVCFWGERATLVDAVTWFHDFQDQCLFWVWLPMKS